MNEFEQDFGHIPIKDQRSMTGTRDHQSPAEVREAWVAWGQRQGWINRPGTPDLLEMDDKHTVDAYINEGRWVATCPACNGGMATWPDHDRSWCSECGRVWKTIFPSPVERQKAEMVLLVRSPMNRNWTPGEEDTETLKAENIVRGLPLRPREI